MHLTRFGPYSNISRNSTVRFRITQSTEVKAGKQSQIG